MFVILRLRCREREAAWEKVNNSSFERPEGCPLADAGSVTAYLGMHDLGRLTSTYIIDGEIRNPYFRKDLMICTGHRKKHTGVRKGDSGGPLVCLRNNTFVVYGVVSFAFRESCTDKQAFTKLTQYLPWLNTAISQLNG
ncbi:hypothetical protein D918_00323 [Trichuris suis]|nr:hypothetical protein D918_00323 [Trichuris suis]